MLHTEMMMIPFTLIQLMMTSIISVCPLEKVKWFDHCECFCYVFTASGMLWIGYYTSLRQVHSV